MAELPSTEDLSTGNRDLKSERSVGAPKGRSLALLCFTTLFGLLSIVAAMFTTILPLSAGWRYFWLIICLFVFALSLTCIILFEQSYTLKLSIEEISILLQQYGRSLPYLLESR